MFVDKIDSITHQTWSHQREPSTASACQHTLPTSPNSPNHTKYTVKHTSTRKYPDLKITMTARLRIQKQALWRTSLLEYFVPFGGFRRWRSSMFRVSRLFAFLPLFIWTLIVHGCTFVSGIYGASLEVFSACLGLPAIMAWLTSMFWSVSRRDSPITTVTATPASVVAAASKSLAC